MDIATPLSIGSQSTGTGAGRVSFHPFSVALHREATYHPAKVTVPDLKLS